MLEEDQEAGQSKQEGTKVGTQDWTRKGLPGVLLDTALCFQGLQGELGWVSAGQEGVGNPRGRLSTRGTG